MQAAARRGALTAAKRHAEHLVNLIEGKNGGDYGDVDHDGSVEDPGDGTGALNYLQQVRDVAAKTDGGSQATAIADSVRNAMTQIIADAKAVAQSTDVQTITAQVGESTALANQINAGTGNSVGQITQALNANSTPPSTAVQNTPNAPNAVSINMKDFEFAPKTMTLKKGTTVIFVNQDPAKHTVTEDSGKFNSKDIQAGANFTFTFDEPGTFPYHCEFHGDKGGVDMAGTIIVQ
jgi:plastocyanin